MYEEWRPILSVQGAYEVSSFGRVRRSDNKIVLKNSINKCGYPVFTARGGLLTPPKDNRRCFPVYVHVCVAKTFIENPLNLKEVNHIDGNKANNRVENLEWCTHAQNMAHAGETGLCPGYNHKPVAQIKNGKIVNKYSSVSLAAKSTGISPTSIGSVANHRITKSGAHYYTAGGYEWQWLN